VIEAAYGITADGFWAARIDYLALIAVPTDSRFRISTAAYLRRPIAEWTCRDVSGADAIVDDEAGFRAYVDSLLLDFRQRAALHRRRVDRRDHTPWGPSQYATIYAEGIICYETASHGGFRLDHERNLALHAALRLCEGWYEEDCDWTRVAVGYPDLFTDKEKTAAEKTLRDWYPDAWEGFYGRPLTAEESFMRDREAFARRHVADWVVIAASQSTEHSGLLVTTATLGGWRGDVETRNFLVPDAEYSIGRHGFVIDPARHQPAA